MKREERMVQCWGESGGYIDVRRQRGRGQGRGEESSSRRGREVIPYRVLLSVANSEHGPRANLASKMSKCQYVRTPSSQVCIPQTTIHAHLLNNQALVHDKKYHPRTRPDIGSVLPQSWMPKEEEKRLFAFSPWLDRPSAHGRMHVLQPSRPFSNLSALCVPHLHVNPSLLTFPPSPLRALKEA